MIQFCLFQIKIWFQNRRTKWKRKYSTDLEILAQHYYQSVGLYAARPMVIGDRLWLFNYPPEAGAALSGGQSAPAPNFDC